MHLKNRRVVEQASDSVVRSAWVEGGLGLSRQNVKFFFVERLCLFENVDPAGLVRSRDRDAELARAHGGCLGTKSR